MKIVAITQSNYIPWRGYFDLLKSADEVILLDSVQYTRRDWRNRNRIKTAHGLSWLTIPVEVKGRFEQPIDETRIADPQWAAEHIRSIEHAYRRAAHYEDVAPWLFELLRRLSTEPLLTKVNEGLLRELCNRLGISSPICRCTELIPKEALVAMSATERLIALAKERGATRYLSGPAARAYLDTGLLAQAGIETVWMAYNGYPDYPQLWGAFAPGVSVIDLMLNTGAEAPHYLGNAG